MKMWIQNSNGQQHQIDTLTDDADRVDMVFDELAKITGRYKFITVNDFKLKNPMVIDMMHPKDNTIKIGEITCEGIKGLDNQK